MKNRLAFLVSSCDKYSDTWDIFFDLLNIYWPNIEYPVYLNTESIPYKPKHQYNFEVNVINTSSKLEWSKRMLLVLNQIEEEYVLLILDDYFIKSPANVKVIEELLNKMDEDQLIGSCQLVASRNQQEKHTQIPQELTMNLVPKEGFKTHFIPTIWRKSLLQKWLRPFESIWGFELYGSQRARIWNYNEKIYTIESPIVYDYLWVDRCSAIICGKWYSSPLIDSFFSDNNIDVDFDKRGRITLEEYYESANTKNILAKYSFWQIIKKIINRIRSLF